MDLPHRVRQLLPQAVGEPDVVLAQGDEVEAGVVAGEGEVALGRALALGEAGVAVGLAPVNAVLGVGLHPHRIGGPRHLPVRTAEGVAVHALALRRDLHQVDRLAGGQLVHLRAVAEHLKARNVPGGPVVPPILGAHRDDERVAGADDGRGEAVNPLRRAAHHLERRRRHFVDPAVARVDVNRQGDPVVAELADPETAAAAARVAVGQRDRVARGQIPAANPNSRETGRTAEAAVRAPDRVRILLQADALPAHPGGHVVIPGRVRGLETPVAAGALCRDHDSAAFRHAERTHRVDHLDRRPTAGFEHPGTGSGHGAQGLLVLIQPGELAHVVVHRCELVRPRFGSRPGKRTVERDEGQVLRHEGPPERSRVRPLPEHRHAPGDRRGAGR